ncbi:hypothetical protein [Actinomadura sp. DC4]|uniref:hypothetical protein n=1 Tax=Actinomadura sp. DC4 TaxID=3055069 RepID=UPI0025AED66D|nr:hypothetical protein [Actinomadura sp. DC4]MDN3359504.1 hypothetical protein [Actinomadura sp. DC4]
MGVPPAEAVARHAEAAASVTGDAWVRYPGDPEYPYRRFVVDAHGGPWKIVDNRFVMGDAHGTVRFDHYAPDTPGGPSVDHWGTITVDYLMTGGPIAVVSGVRSDDVPANQRRATLTFYMSPQGHRFDRMGFSWGVVDARCQQMGTGPAPFSPASAGPSGRFLKGYTVRDAPLPIPSGEVSPPADPPGCTY